MWYEFWTTWILKGEKKRPTLRAPRHGLDKKAVCVDRQTDFRACCDLAVDGDYVPAD